MLTGGFATAFNENGVIDSAMDSKPTVNFILHQGGNPAESEEILPPKLNGARIIRLEGLTPEDFDGTPEVELIHNPPMWVRGLF